MNSPTYRASHAMLYINDQCFGLYYVLEDIDEKFLKSRFGNDKGALYKCEGDLTYQGPNPDIYKNITYANELAYDPKTVTNFE